MSVPSTSSAVGLVCPIVAGLVLWNIFHGCLKGFLQDFLLREFVVDVRALSTGGYRRALFLGLGDLLLRLSLLEQLPFPSLSGVKRSASWLPVLVPALPPLSPLPRLHGVGLRQYLGFCRIFSRCSDTCPGVTAAVRTRLSDCPDSWTRELSSLKRAR